MSDLSTWDAGTSPDDRAAGRLLVQTSKLESLLGTVADLKAEQAAYEDHIRSLNRMLNHAEKGARRVEEEIANLTREIVTAASGQPHTLDLALVALGALEADATAASDAVGRLRGAS